jgi:hypothetical protein
VETVVKAAAERAIRVVPEFDLPAHTAPAWCVGEPTICSQSGSAVDPSAPRLYEVIEAVIKHAAALFPDEYIHLGGDEVTLGDWTNDEKIAAYLTRQHPGLTLDKAAEVEAYGVFMRKVQAIASKYQKKVIHWEDVFDWAGPLPSCGGVTPTLSNETVVQVFRGGFGPGPKPCKDQLLGGCVCGSNGAATTKASAAAGYKTIWGPPRSWYLSCYADKCDANDGGGAGVESWQHVYAQEPFLCENGSAAGCGTHGADVAITDPVEQQRVIGGEVTVWSERLDPAIMLATAFPRAAAAAERLWSPRAENIVAETKEAEPRMEALRCALLDRGLAVSTLEGGNEASNFSLPSRPTGPGPNCGGVGQAGRTAAAATTAAAALKTTDNLQQHSRPQPTLPTKLAAAAAPTSDIACSLNGRLSPADGKTCICRPAWHGPACAQLVLQPATRAFEMDGAVAWGAAPIFDKAEGRWHLFVATYKGGLGDWNPNSHIYNAVASKGASPAGPYKLASDSPAIVAVGKYHCSPAILETEEDGKLRYYLYSSGSAWNTSAPDPPAVYNSTGAFTGAGTLDVSTSFSLNGPWKYTEQPKIFGAAGSAGNPSVIKLANGTYVLTGDSHSSNGGAFMGPSPLGPWTPTNPSCRGLPLTCGGCTAGGAWTFTSNPDKNAYFQEDHRIFQDKVGSGFHVFGHYMSLDGDHSSCHACDSGPSCTEPLALSDQRSAPPRVAMHTGPPHTPRDHSGGHTFSRSAAGPWHNSPTPPYNCTVQWASGETTSGYRRERPYVLQHPVTGDPEWLFNGIDFGNGSHPFVMVQKVGPPSASASGSAAVAVLKTTDDDKEPRRLSSKPKCPAVPHGDGVSEVPCLLIPKCSSAGRLGAAAAGAVASNFTVMGSSGGIANPPLIAEQTTATVCWSDDGVDVTWSAVDENVVFNCSGTQQQCCHDEVWMHDALEFYIAAGKNASWNGYWHNVTEVDGGPKGGLHEQLRVHSTTAE